MAARCRTTRSWRSSRSTSSRWSRPGPWQAGPRDRRRTRPAGPCRPAALAFSRLSSQNRFAVLLRIGQAKRAETRLRRSEGFAAMLARGEAPYPQRGPILPGEPA
ncbi:MAG: YdeI/OmpD-associated family protein [Candidatus Nanopelagicales bacterium]